MGHEFKIDLEPKQPQSTAHLQDQPLELPEAKTQIDSMLEHGFIRPSQSHGVPQYYLYLRKMTAFGSVWITVC